LDGCYQAIIQLFIGVTPHESCKSEHHQTQGRLVEPRRGAAERLSGLPGDGCFIEALLHEDRRRANVKNRVDEVIEAAVVAFVVENPAAGQVRVSNELRKRGMFVSPTGVRSIWLRHHLQTFRLAAGGFGEEGR
jgi:hypothetical protein